MKWNELIDAIHDARQTVKMGDEAIQQLASVCVGRLRSAKVSGTVLCELKRELRSFDMVTREWK